LLDQYERRAIGLIISNCIRGYAIEDQYKAKEILTVAERVIKVSIRYEDEKKKMEIANRLDKIKTEA